MNPCSADQGGSEEYAGSEALDPALADRFSVFVNADDWGGLSEDDRKQIANSGGEGKISDDGGKLRSALKSWREIFLNQIDECPDSIVTYAVVAVSSLNAAGIRVSPRRSRLLSRSLLAATIIEGSEKSTVFRRILKASLPHPCWGVVPPAEAIAAAHRAAWDSSRNTENAWLHRFLSESFLSDKLQILIDNCKSPDAGCQALAQLFTIEPKLRAAAFAFAVYPAAASDRLPIGAEGVNDLGKIAAPILSVEGEISWQERLQEGGTNHPDMAGISRVLTKLKGGRAERAKQFFSWALVAKCSVPDPGLIEGEIDACVRILQGHLSK
jgi:MoxR-like ATPase